MNIEELPGIPRIWIDFLRCKLPFLPGSRRSYALNQHAEAVASRSIQREDLCRSLADAAHLCSARTQESIQLLRQPDSVAVVTNFYPSLFGGPSFQLLKCLTALKLCEVLAQNKISAVPVCWICEALPDSFSKCSVQLIDDESEIHHVQLEHDETNAYGVLRGDEISRLLLQISEMGHGNFDPDVLEVLNASYGSGATLDQASARLISSLMQEWGMVVFSSPATDLAKAACAGQFSENADSAWLIQSLTLPVMANVVDPFEIHSFVETRPAFSKLELIEPLVWPQASATIVDSRSRRILGKRNLNLKQLFLGEDAILNEALACIPHSVSEKLIGLKQEVSMRVADLHANGFAGSKFGKTAQSGKGKIVYQLDHLREHFEAACRRREETTRRQVHRVCNALAPNRRMQEREIAGVHTLLRYSRSALQTLYKKLDIMDSEHQLIFMD